ncbi:axonemal dynein light chain domain-containing protein 1 [Poecilia reticulata]|uniref:Axonemal dynein light chain domain containing 1 n=1 Tax=Poecilia reticulata TaxID=8081 RepID=A0A3P9P7R5_POERE|nr:PREDICTED: axonemal dynein light chain domain-containing protein 1 [Poecilia reticulata]XP_008404800.1 PREDICTED: axonemal dynein light chain domain-containing protein 1 [Poecilia reticulata]
MSLSTARASPAPSSPRGEQADETDLRVQLPALEIRKGPLPVKQAAIPDELLLSLTSTVSKNTQGHTAHHRSCENDGIRRPDGVWHYPLGRNKYKYFLEQPTSLTEAGRDISFLCDAVLTQKKMTALPPLHEKSCNGDTNYGNLDVKQNVIPEEYRIVKNKGIRSLQLYEDAFTVQLKDQEQKLRVLPSLRPSGRLEVIQLMRMMDDMLEKAGVDQDNEELTDLCQLESLLELVKTEQNIYNIVFHELIRQVTVSCAERGQLLAKLRQRYQSLLERIPRRLTSLHAEVVAQRALDRRLIEEIYHIKATIQEINMELAKVRDHDAFVSDKVQHAQEELAKTYKETLSCSDVVQGYHHMYELHRTRLEDQLLKMMEDRDYWRQFTFNLALKVIKVKKLRLVRELYVSEESWFKTAQDCLIYISTQDICDLDVIVELANKWRDQLIGLMFFVKKIQLVQFEQLSSIQGEIKKWRHYVSIQNLDEAPEYDVTTLAEIHADVWKWSNKLSLASQECQGERKILFQKRLSELYSTLDRFIKISFYIVERHTFPDVESAMSLETIKELESDLLELLRQYETQISVIHQLLTSMFKLMDFWASETHDALQLFCPQSALTASDSVKLEEALSNCQHMSAEIFLYFHFAQKEKQTDPEMVQIIPDLYSGSDKSIDEVHELKKRLFSFSETENKKLEEEVTCFHKGQTNWMLELLLHLLPDQTEEEDKNPKREDKSENSRQALVKDAKGLSKKLVYYSRFITRACNSILEQLLVVDPYFAEVGDRKKQLKKLQTDGNKWMESVKILLKVLNEEFEAELIEQPEETSSIPQPPESMETQTSGGPLQEPRQAGKTKDGTEPEKTEMTSEEPETEQQERPTVKLIDYDGNIIQIYQDENMVQLPGGNELVVCPVIEEAQKAFSDLTTVILLQKELSDSEKIAIIAQNRAREAEEALTEALNKIKDLERLLQRQPAPEPPSKDEEKKTPPCSPPPAAEPTSET